MLNISPLLTGTTGTNGNSDSTGQTQLTMSPLVVPSGDPSTWTQAQIAAMTQSDIQSLTQTQLGELSPTQMGYFTATQIPYFTATQVTVLEPNPDSGFYECLRRRVHDSPDRGDERQPSRRVFNRAGPRANDGTDRRAFA